MHTLKLAMVQQRAVPNDSQANLQLALGYIEQASLMGADLVLFPEMWSNGYAAPFDGAFDNPFDPRFDHERTQWLESAIAIDSSYIHTIKQAAKEHCIGVVATYLAKTSSKPQNVAIVIDRNGEIIMDYAKVHTCDFSLEGLLQNGNEFKVCDFEGIKLGIMICYDREFPESARVLMLKGAEIILVPNACDMNPARLNQLNTRAFENMVGVAMANYPGTGWGCSCAFSPIVFDTNGSWLDNTMVKADEADQCIVMAEFDMDSIRAYREQESWGNAYRKPHAYAELLSNDVKPPFIREQ